MKSDTGTPPKDKVKNFKKQSSGNSKHRKIVSLIKGNRKQILETPESEKTVALNISETNAWLTTYCQKWHHFASVCMAKKKGMVNFVQESQDSSDSEESVLKVEDVSSVESCGNP